MDVEQFNERILVPALKIIGLYSIGANVLMLGTALIESDLVFIEQIGSGKGLGIYQIEPSTYADLQRYLNRHENGRLKETCLSACFYHCYPSDDALVHNLRYATIMARIKYWMRPEPLPRQDDAEAMSAYHKRFYNSMLGKTDPKSSVLIFERVMSELKL